MKVLIPFDGSQAAQHALEMGLKLAQQDNSIKLTIISVASPDLCFIERKFLLNPTAVMEDCREFLQENLEKVKQWFFEEGVWVRTILKEGDAATVIIDTINEGNFDHVIMGRRGLSALRGFLIGSISAKVLANVDVPVTLLK